MPTVTWARVDPARRAAVVEAAEAEFGAHGFSRGSLNVIARRAGVAKGSLFQYFADKRDLYAFIADIASQRVRSYMEDLIRELDPNRPFFEFLTDLLDGWVAYFAEHPRERALHAAATLEVDTDARISVRSVLHRNAKFWDPADIDFTRDRADWEKLSDDERDYATRLCTQFIAGEEAVTEDIQPFMSAMRAEGRLADEMYLTQFAFEEAKHTQVFRMWLDAVGISEDLHRYLDDLPAYRQIFYAELPECLNALSADPSPAAQVRASVTYNHIVEGMLALTGYYAWHKICVERAILPGMQELVRRIGDDERRHMAWGTFTCRRHVAADDANWTVFETRMNELIPLALRLIEEGFALYGDQPPFDLSKDDFLQYSTDKGMRRFGTISNARGRPVAEIDVDYSPAQLEDTFADEDRRTLAAASA